MYGLQRRQFNYDPESQLILRKGEMFERYMNPFLYLRKNYLYLDSDLLKKKLVNQIQVTLHDLLESYLNSLFLPAILIGAPKTAKFVKKLENLQWCFAQLSQLEEKEDVRHIAALYRKSLRKRVLTSRQIAALISISYKSLYRFIKKNEFPSEKRQWITNSKTFSEVVYKDKIYRPIIDLWKHLKKYLNGYLANFFLHGSYSSMDHCSYSDLDTLMIIKKEVIDNETQLLNLQKIIKISMKQLYLMDSLQHHGHFVITEYDLHYFPETFFPLAIFDYSTSFINTHNEPLKIVIRNSDMEAFNQIWNLCYTFREAYFNKAFPQTIYDLKVYLSKLMLMPALYLQVKGKSCYKSESFREAKHYFSTPEWEALEESSNIRYHWKLPGYVKWVFKQPIIWGIDPRLVSMFGNMVLQKLPLKIEGYVSHRFYDKANFFSESIIKRLQKDWNDRIKQN
jgi:hypothetical protein